MAKDTATFIKPRQYSHGIDHVIVNGKVVIDGGGSHRRSPWKDPLWPGKNMIRQSSRG